MNESRDLSMYLSVQPFWKAQKTRQGLIFLEDRMEPVAFAYEMTVSDGVQGMHSIPGTGLIGLTFALDCDCRSAQCCGPLSQTKLVPLPEGVKRTFVCHFFPGEFTRITGIPSKLLENTELSLDNIPNVSPLAEAIASAPDFDARVCVMQKAVSLWASRTKERKAASISQNFISLALSSGGDIRIKELEQEIGYSGRHLQNIIAEQVGLSPKNALDNIRFQCALRMMLEHPAYPLSRIAQQSGFYDQAHFSKVFKRVMGYTPAAFMQEHTLHFQKINL